MTLSCYKLETQEPDQVVVKWNSRQKVIWLRVGSSYTGRIQYNNTQAINSKTFLSICHLCWTIELLYVALHFLYIYFKIKIK